MTVTYSEEMSSATGMVLIKLLVTRWKGSLFKLIWQDLLIFVFVFYALQAIYYFGCDDESCRKNFEALVYYAKKDAEKIPISFLLGFFVSNVMARWWSQYESIPVPSRFAVFVTATIHGNDEVGRVMRRTIMRYVNLALVMIFRVLSPRVKKRYPKMDDLIEAGFITESELAVMKALDEKYPLTTKSWLPICWATSICNRARTEGRIRDDMALKTLIDDLNDFRGKLATLMDYNAICIPLVYVQVVTLAVYSFFLTMVIAKQPIHPEYNKEYEDMKFLDNLPFLITLQFIFYMGWLKVAETMINPWGEDDDDFNINSMIDSNLILSYLIVDEMHSQYPDLLKDRYWNNLPRELPDMGKEVGKKGEITLTDFFDVTTAARQQKTNKKNALLIPLDDKENQQAFQPAPLVPVPKTGADGANLDLGFGGIGQASVKENLRKTRDRAVSIKLSEISSSDEEYK